MKGWQGTCRPMSDFEEIIKRLAGRRRPLRTGLTLDGGARRKVRTVVARVFRRNARGERILRALESSARVERHALDARMQIDAASRTSAVECHGQREPVPAAGAPE